MKRTLAFALVAACGSSATPQIGAPRPTADAAEPRPEPAPPPPADTAALRGAATPPAETPPATDATALKTRAHPLALFVARMHNRLHVRWAEMYLEALATKPVTDPLNDPTLAVTLELAIDVEGALADVHVVTPSHQQAFDDAALDAFRASAPFDTPSGSILASDGLVHLRWTLHRDERECGTFGVEPLQR